MDYVLLAIRYVNFIDKDGEQVEGYQVYLGRSNDKVVGVMPCKHSFWFSVHNADKYHILSYHFGDRVKVSFNEYGRIVSFEDNN